MNQKQKIATSFQMVKNDFNSLKTNMSEWILFLNRKQAETDNKIKVLEDKIDRLERIKRKSIFD